MLLQSFFWLFWLVQYLFHAGDVTSTGDLPRSATAAVLTILLPAVGGAWILDVAFRVAVDDSTSLTDLKDNSDNLFEACREVTVREDKSMILILSWFGAAGWRGIVVVMTNRGREDANPEIDHN